jgi:hypothetical protein
MNALKHGLTAAEIVLPTEDKLEFEQFQAAFEEECQPVGPIEQVLVEDLVAARWRMNRVRKMEPGFFTLRLQAMRRQIKEDFSNLDAQAHLALIFRDDAQDADTIGSCSASKPSVPQCPILGMGLFRKTQFHRFPNRHPTPFPTPFQSPKRQRAGRNPPHNPIFTPIPRPLPIYPSETTVNLCEWHNTQTEPRASASDLRRDS